MSTRSRRQPSVRGKTGSRKIPDVKSAIKDIKGSVAQPFALPRKPRSDEEAQRLYYHIRTLCYWLDAASSIIQIPGTSRLPFHFGLEAIIGTLLPVVGDIFGLVLGLYIIVLCMQFGLPAGDLWKMFTNCMIDAIVGVVPIVGDLLDLAFQSNMRNLDILENHLLSSAPPAPQETPEGLIAPSTHFVVRIPPAGQFWPKTTAPSASSFYANPDSSPNSSYSFFSNIFGSSTSSNGTGGWKLGGAKRAEVEEVGGWTGESARMLWYWLVALFARISGKTQQAAGAAKARAQKKAR